MLLNYSISVNCAAIICQGPKSASLFLCVKTDEAGDEDGKLLHQRWHSAYLMVFTGTAKDQSQKHCTLIKSQNASLAKKQGGPCLIKMQTGKHVAMEVHH